MTDQQRIELPKWLIGLCVTVGIFLAMQTGGLIWMLSGMNTQQNHMSNDVMAIKLELQRDTTNAGTGAIIVRCRKKPCNCGQRVAGSVTLGNTTQPCPEGKW